MYDPFAMALGVLHRAAGSVAAVYTPAGGDPLPEPIRVIRKAHQADLAFGDTTIPTRATTWSIMRADVDQPTAGASLTVDGQIFEIIGEPRLSAEGLAWIVEAPGDE